MCPDPYVTSATYYFTYLLTHSYNNNNNNNNRDPVLSQKIDLLDFSESDILPAAQLIASKYYKKTQWFGRLLFYRLGVSMVSKQQ